MSDNDHTAPGPVDELREIFRQYDHDRYGTPVHWERRPKWVAAEDKAIATIQAKITEAYEKGKADAKRSK